MNQLLLSAIVVSAFVTGCGRAALQAPAGAASAEQAAAQEAPAEAALAKGEEAAAPAGEAAPPAVEGARMPGYYVAYRFSGSFRKSPLTLTQRVVAREGDVLVVDVTLEGDEAPEALRVRMSDAPATRGEVLEAAWIEGGAERPATRAAYDELMAKTALSADTNEGALATEDVTIDVGGAAIACQKTSYRVRIGKRQATMRTLQSDGFAWGDVGGEITAEDGRVLYRAEIIDAGRSGAAQTPAPSTVAHFDEDE